MTKNWMKNISHNSIQPLCGWWNNLFRNRTFHARLLIFNPFGINLEEVGFIQMSYDINTKGHGGTVEVKSEVGKGLPAARLPVGQAQSGTEFKILIPANISKD